jgi:phospholipid/cholesterol/gamma-HCH transport system ATP-binding protein
MSFIELRNVHKRFGRLIVLDGIDLSIERGKCLVIIGASGTGKSVLIKHLVGLLRPDRGEVWFDGKRIDHLSERELMPIRNRIGFLFQMSALFDSLTVADNVAFPLTEHTTKQTEEIHQLAEQKLAMVGLPGIGGKLPGELSGGQKKRVALARAIAMNPEVILYDEPTTGLDPIRSDVINELILKLQRELRATSIVVTHDMHSAFKVGDRIVMLHEGRVVFDGPPTEILESKNVIVHRFVMGEAGEQELAALRAPHNKSSPTPFS